MRLDPSALLRYFLISKIGGMNFDILLTTLIAFSLNTKLTSDTTPKNLNDYTPLFEALLMKIGCRTIGFSFLLQRNTIHLV